MVLQFCSRIPRSREDFWYPGCDVVSCEPLRENQAHPIHYNTPLLLCSSQHLMSLISRNPKCIIILCTVLSKSVPPNCWSKESPLNDALFHLNMAKSVWLGDYGRATCLVVNLLLCSLMTFLCPWLLQHRIAGNFMPYLCLWLFINGLCGIWWETYHSIR